MNSETTWTMSQIFAAYAACAERIKDAPSWHSLRCQLLGVSECGCTGNFLCSTHADCSPGTTFSARRSQPAPEAVAGEEREPDWSRFVPTGPLPYDDDLWDSATFKDGLVFAAWARGTGAAVWRRQPYSQPHGHHVYLAGPGNSWMSGHVRIIRHADGRWADGYNPEGPCKGGCGNAFHPAAMPSDWVAGNYNPDDLRWAYCTPFCADRAKAKDGEPGDDAVGRAIGELAAARPVVTRPAVRGVARQRDPIVIGDDAEQPAAPPGSSQDHAGIDGCDHSVGVCRFDDPPAPVAGPMHSGDPRHPGHHYEDCATRLGTSRNCDCPASTPLAAPAVPQPGVPEGWTSGVVTCLSYLNHRCAHPACVKAAMTKEGQEEAKRLARVLADATPIGAPATSAAVQGGISTEPFNRWMHAVGRRLERADLPLASFLAGQAALEAVNAELRAQAVKAEQFFADHTAAHERQLTELRADNDRLRREVVRLGDERDEYKTKRDEWRRTADADNEKARKLNEQLAARDSFVAGLEASSADLVRRAQEAEESRDRWRQNHRDAQAALRDIEEDLQDQVAELRGKLAAAERERDRWRGDAVMYGSGQPTEAGK